MRHDTTSLLIALAVSFGLNPVSSSASAADLPPRKPGLWEVKTAIGGAARPLVVQQCVDAATDQALQSNAGPFSASVCPDREVKKSDTSVTIDSHCSIGGKAGSAHAVITGSLDSVYAMTVTAEGGGLPAVTMAIEGKWLGACAAGQQPGDVIMPGGVKVNLLDLQKRAVAPDPVMEPGK